MTNTLPFEGSAEERTEKAQAAVKVFRSMLPSLNGFVRALTGNPRARIEVHPTSNGGTDGQTIMYRPPIALGDKRPHDKGLCDKRDDAGQQRCPACHLRESILTTLYHEMAHIAFNTFAPVSPDHAADFTRRAAEEWGSKYAKAIVERLNALPERQRNNYLTLASMLSPFLPLLLNGLEDARVNARMFAARPGTRAMFEANVREVMANGFETHEGTVRWNERPLNAQITIGLYAVASGYDYTGWFHEKVEHDLKDAKLVGICEQVAGSEGAGQVYNLAFKALARLRELGYCLSERDPDVEEEEDEQPDDESVPEPDSGEGEQPDGDASEPEHADSDQQGEGEDEQPEAEEADGTSEPDGSADDSDAHADPDQQGSDEPDSGEAPSDEPASDEADDGSESDAGDPGDGDSGAGADDDGGPADSEDAGDDADSEGDDGGAPEGEGADGRPDEAGGSDGVDDQDSEAGDDSSGQDSGEADASNEQQDGVDSDGEESANGGAPDSEGEEGADQPEAGGELGTGDRSADAPVADNDEPLDGDGADDAGEGQPEGDVTDGAALGEAGSPGGADEGVSGDVPPGDSADVGEVRDDETPAAEAGEGDDGRHEVSDDGDQPSDSDGALDVGPAKKAGWAEPLPEYGEARDVEGDLDAAMHHDGDQVAPSGDIVYDTQDDAEEVAREIIQGIYFETGSLNVAGVVEHRRDDERTGAHWSAAKRFNAFDRRQRGIDGDFTVPESVLGAALQRMRVVFSENRRAVHTRNLKAGKVNARSLGKRAWGDDERLFRRKQQPGKRDYSVVIGMDISGSTAGQEIAIEKRAVMAQAELLNRMGIRFAIVAHSTQHGGVPGMTGGITLSMYHVKEFDQPWTDKTRDNLSSLASGNGNLDGHSMEFYRKMLDRENTTDRIIMYYTDGAMPASNYDEELEILRRELQVCAQKRYTVMGVGIRTDSPTEHGLDTVVVEEDSDIVNVVKFLERRLERTVR